MGQPGWVEVDAPSVTLRALVWKPRRDSKGAPTALCLHGFPDTAHGWRLVAPKLASAGWRVVASFMRGYAPSTIYRATVRNTRPPSQYAELHRHWLSAPTL